MLNSIHEMVRSQVFQQPGHAAVCQEGEVLTYGDLETKSTRLAHDLRSAGVDSGSAVGLCIEQSIHFVVGALGIMKCGAAYVPLDPSLPSTRLEFMIQDAGISNVVTTSHRQNRFRVQGQVLFQGQVLLIDSPAVASSVPDFPRLDVQPEQLAYVIYTSGTTGKPKGVEITHRGLANLAQWCSRAFQLGPADHTTLFAPVAFDAAARELWPHLAAGCTLLIPPAGLLRNPEELCQWLVANEITISYLPTPLAGRVVRMSWPERAKLRYVYTGGDALRDYPIPGLPFRLINEYGPAECTVFATSAVVPVLSNPTQAPTIGRPIDGAQIYLLDDQMKETAAGEIGEIYIGGEGLARGYRNNPELTRRSFVLGIHGASREKRIYKTGDLGRYTLDGELVFLGRNDDQVKIRGYRIECGEVETFLNQVEGVDASAVAKRQYGPADYRLVAYIVTTTDRKITREELCRFLRARLPEYMIPDEFVRMSGLPLTSNDKIDRAALPAPHPGNTIKNAEAYDSIVERHLATILQKVLGVEQIGRDDNIFLRGGDSFVAIQLIAHIQREFGITLTPRKVFNTPTSAGLAMEIEQAILARLAAQAPAQG